MNSDQESPDPRTRVEQESTLLSIPSSPEWIAPTIEYLNQRAILCGACDETRCAPLAMALGEALTNSIVHGNLEVSSDLKRESEDAFVDALARRSADPAYASRTVDIEVDYRSDGCRWVLTDQGQGFDTEAVIARLSRDDLDAPCGRGIVMMRMLVDDIQYELGGRRVILTLNRPTGHEKRREPRYHVRRPTRVVPVLPDGRVDWSAAYDAITEDMSEGGMALLQQSLTTANRVIVEVQYKGQPAYVPVEICRCEPIADGMVQLGCRLDDRLAIQDAELTRAESQQQTEIHAAIDHLLEEHQRDELQDHERREYLRVDYTQRITVRRGGSSEPQHARARDLSKGGLAFVAAFSLPMEEIEIELPSPNRPPIQLRARVVRCREITKGIFDLGTRFVDLLNETNL